MAIRGWCVTPSLRKEGTSWTKQKNKLNKKKQNASLCPHFRSVINKLMDNGKMGKIDHIEIYLVSRRTEI